MEQERLQQVVYALAHDMGAPVRHIKAFSSLLRSANPDLEADSETYLEHLEQASGLLNRMLDGLLQLSRVTSIGVPVETAMTTIAERLGLVSAVSGAQCSVTALLSLDRAEVALAALRDNAERYGECAGCELVCHDGSVLLRVLDSGGGIPEDRWADALLPFNRLGQRIDDESLGMGLTIARAAVESMGGSLQRQPDALALVLPLNV